MEPWMIEQIRKQQEEQRRESERPRLRIQPPRQDWGERREQTTPQPEEERGVWIVQM